MKGWVNDQPWNGPDPPASLHLYSPDRKAKRPASHLECLLGVPQVDGNVGFEKLTGSGAIVLATPRWAHA